MTTLVRPDAPTDGSGGGGEAPPSAHEPSRYAAWRSSWAVALRMARRDVRRHEVVLHDEAVQVVDGAVPALGLVQHARERRDEPCERFHELLALHAVSEVVLECAEQQVPRGLDKAAVGAQHIVHQLGK